MKHTAEYPTWDAAQFRALLDGIETRFADNIAFMWRDPAAPDGIACRTYADAARDVRNLATYLCAMGLQNRPVAVCGKNSYEWEIAYLAIGCGCGMIVPIDRDLRADEMAYQLADAGCAAILYGDDVRAKAEAIDDDRILKLPLSDTDLYLSRGDALRQAGSRSYENHTADADAPGVLLYTCGTPGIARGILLSQRGICANVTALCKTVGLRETDRMLSHLPLFQSYECTMHLAMLYSGACIAFGDGIRHMPSDLALFRPTVLVTVPAVLEFMARFVEKGYAGARGGRLLLGVQRAATGVVSHTVGHLSRSTAEKSRRTIFSTVHSFMGGRLRAIAVGEAPLSAEIFRRFEQFGYAVYTGFGLTEAAPIILSHTDKYRSPDDNGFPLPGSEVRIDNPDEDGIGKMCVRGPSVMLGYYRDEAATAAVLQNGWLSTGVLARRTESGAYRITGRNTDIILSPTGKKIYPAELESYFCRHPLVHDCRVYEEQEGTGVLCAAIAPDRQLLADALGLPPETDPAMLSEADTARAKALLLEVVTGVNASHPPYKHIKKLILRSSDFPHTADAESAAPGTGN